MRRPWLLPLVPLYRAGQLLLNRRNDNRQAAQTLAAPVISIGNVSTGGTGKTPFTIALAKLMKHHGFAVDVLSRGYGRTGGGIEYLGLKNNPFQDPVRFGDEPILIARQAQVPVYVAASRFAAGQMAEGQHKAEPHRLVHLVHLLDDGFQHRRLARLIDIALVNSEDLTDSLLPAGNLREPIAALSRADILAIPVGDDQAVELVQRRGLTQPIWRFHRHMTVPSILAPVVAFCGIARPEQFFLGLEESGVPIAARHPFPDHHRFTARDIQTLKTLLKNSAAQAFLTTAKDHIRLGAMSQSLEQAAQIHVADLEVRLEDVIGIVAWIQNRIKSRLELQF